MMWGEPGAVKKLFTVTKSEKEPTNKKELIPQHLQTAHLIYGNIIVNSV